MATIRSFAPIAPDRSALLRECVVLGGLAAAFATLLLLVARSAPTSFDRRWAAEIQAIPWGELAFVPRLGSDLGGGVSGAYLVPAIVVAGFVAFRQWRPLLLLGAVIVLHFLMISPKLFVTAYRPSPLFGVEGSGGLGSFPSGHVQWSASFLGLLAYLTWRAAPVRFRLPIVAVYAAAVLATMLGRIELGRHWPIDTVGGAIAGLIALRLVILLHRWLGRLDGAPRVDATPVGSSSVES
jgi:membrane-associated phospholipid phosphatase